MSNLVSALNGASFEGFARVEEQGLRGMITLRGDLTSKEMAEAVKAAAGTAMPEQREITVNGDFAVAWMSSDELLLLCPYEDVAKSLEALDIALAGSHSMIANVSDARALIRVSGAGAREVVAKLAPVDFSSEAFPKGAFRRSRMAQVAAAMWMSDDNAVDVICFRSVAPYVMGLLTVSAEKGGEVGLYS